MTKIIFTIIFWVSSTLAFGQEFQHGLILPEETENEELCCIYSPRQGFSVYGKPGGSRIGTLTRYTEENKNFDSYYQIYFIDGKSGNAARIALDDFQEIGYKIWAVTYFEKRNGFVRIIDEDYSYWLSEREIENHGFRLREWQEFLSDNAGYLMGFYAKSPGLNLREGPDTDSNVIMALRGTTNQILPQKEHSGAWTKVKVILLKEKPCETNLSEKNNIKEELEGWIKIVDDYGKLNVWYYPRGC